MATKNIAGLRRQNTHAHTYGILNRRFIKWDVSAVAADDDYRLWQIPRGAKVFEVEAVLQDPKGSAGTVDVGYRDDAEGGVTDLDHFIGGFSVNGAVGTSARSITDTAHEPYVCDGDEVFLTIQAKAAIAAKTVVHLYVSYEFEGNL